MKMSNNKNDVRINEDVMEIEIGNVGVFLLLRPPHSRFVANSQPIHHMTNELHVLLCMPDVRCLSVTPFECSECECTCECNVNAAPATG